MPDFLIPEGNEELSFHEHMLKDRPTVRGIRFLAETDPLQWKQMWQNSADPDHWYRLVYCDNCGYFIGDVALKKQGEDNAMLWLLILGDLRGSGYGSAVLKQTAKAFKGILKTFTVVLPADHPDLSFFTNRGFVITEKTADKITLRAEVSTLSRCRAGECCSKKAESM